MSEENRTSIFRKKSEEYIDSPEKLDNYLHVTNPGVWAVLAATLILLIGVGIWSVFGKLETKMNVAVVAESGKCTVYVTDEAVESVVESRTVTLDGEDYSLNPSSLEPIAVTDSTNIYVRQAGNLSVGDIVYEIPMDGELEDGVYSGTVVTETISPISLLLN